MKNKKKIVGVGIILVFFITLVFHFQNYYNLYKLPPSELWSKEVEIGKGNVKNNPVIIKEEDKILTAFDDNKKLHIVITDLMGKMLSSKNFEVEEEFIKDIIFVKTKNGYELGYNSNIDGMGYLDKFILDKELNVVNKEKMEGVNYTYQLDESNYVSAYVDKIEVINSISNKIQKVESDNTFMLTGSKTEDGFFICFIQGQDIFKFFTVIGDKVSDVKIAAQLNKAERISYEQISCSTDGKKGYIVLEESTKGEFTGARSIEFALDGSNSINNPLYINNSKIIRQNIGRQSKDGGKFYGVFGRTFGKKSYQENIISYTIKQGKPESIEYVSRTREMCYLPYIENDYVGFLSFNSIDNVNVNIASINTDFKEVNNVPRASEKSRAFSSTAEGLMYSLSYVFVYGFKWILPTMLIVGIISFFDYAYSEKTKIRGFIVLAILAVALKTYGIIPTVYGMYGYAVPDIIGSKMAGIAICSIIGAISYYYAFLIYKKDTEDIGILKFGYGLIIDTILTLVVFVPFIT
jgi:hypothetical protein